MGVDAIRLSVQFVGNVVELAARNFVASGLGQLAAVRGSEPEFCRFVPHR